MRAPMPQRPQAQPPPAATVQSPVGGRMEASPVTQQQPTTWQPGMPIVFGGLGGGGGQQAQPGGAQGGGKVNGVGTWDPSKGVRFVPR